MIAHPYQAEVVISYLGTSIRLPPTSPESAQKVAEVCLDAYPGKLIEIAQDGIRKIASKREK